MMRLTRNEKFCLYDRIIPPWVQSSRCWAFPNGEFTLHHGNWVALAIELKTRQGLKQWFTHFAVHLLPQVDQLGELPGV